MKRIILLLFLIVLFPFIQGCAFGNGASITLTGQDAYASHTSLKTAILTVEVPETEAPVSSLDSRIWGTVQPPNAQHHFAELLAHFAENTGNINIVRPEDVAERLRDADLEPDLAPSPGKRKEFMDTLQCEAYLQASIKRWDYTYFLFRQKVHLRCTISFHRPGQPSPVWKADVFYRSGGESDREAAATALRQLFEQLKGEQ